MLEISERHRDYEEAYNYKITRRLPIMVRLDGCSFSRLTKKLPRPYSPDFLTVMAETMLSTISDIQGAVLGYCQSDEITLVIKNDQSLDSEAWLNNRLQKICSKSASKATSYFKDHLQGKNLPLLGNVEFDSRVWTLPYISEVANNLIWRQMDAIKNSTSNIAQAAFGQKMGKKQAINYLHGKNTQEKSALLLSECGIEVEDYESAYRLGVVAAKIPTPVQTDHGIVLRNKWKLNYNPPNFLQDKDFLYSILINDKDIIRGL